MPTNSPMLSKEKIEKGAFILRAISNPARLKIIELLAVNERLNVSEICELIETEQSSTSHHLINLKLKGILSSKREGKNIYYSLKEREILKIFNCLEECDCNFVP